MSILFYKRPDYVSKEGGPMTASSCQRYAEKASGNTCIPDSLSFEKIMENQTMPPCSLQDFLDYLVYVAHDAENLQFYLWLQDYKQRFAKLPITQQRLSPESRQDTVAPDLRKPGAASVKSNTDDLLDKDIEAQYLANLQKLASRKGPAPAPPIKDFEPNDNNSLTSPALSSIFPIEASRRWQQSTSQPFRPEINQIITHYLLPSSPRELNLSHRVRASVLSALHRTTHPSAFAPVEQLTLLTLRHHAHPNFVRWSLCNGNRPRVFLLRSLAVLWLVLFAAGTVALILSSSPRWARLGLAPLFWFGLTNLIAAVKGLCILLHRLHTRELRPWEIYDKDSETTSGSFNGPDHQQRKHERDQFADELAKGATAGGILRKDADNISQSSQATLFRSGTPTLSTSASSPTKPSQVIHEQPPTPTSSRPSMEAIDIESAPTAPLNSVALRLSPLGPRNNFDEEAWVERWNKMGFWRKASMRKVWMKEEGLRLMQNNIIIQAQLWALIVTVFVEAGICAAPVVGLY